MALTGKTEEKIRAYLEHNARNPYFVAIKSSDAKDAYSTSWKFCLSELCSNDDRRPDVGFLEDEIMRRCQEEENCKIMVLGLGEYLAFRGEKTALQTIRELRMLSLPPNSKVVFPLRFMTKVLNKIKEEDIRFERCYYNGSEGDSTLVNIEIYEPTFPLPVNQNGEKFVRRQDDNGDEIDVLVEPNFKSLLHKFEMGDVRGARGKYRAICVQTSQLPEEDSFFQIRFVGDSFEYLQGLDPYLRKLGNCGETEQWKWLVEQISKSGSIDAVFGAFDNDNPERRLSKQLPSPKNENDWLWFIAMRRRLERGDVDKDSYLSYVLRKTERLEDFRANYLNGLLDFKHDHPCFKRFYDERKNLIPRFTDQERANFVHENRRDSNEALYRLTDASMQGRCEIVSQVAQKDPKEWNDELIERIYPELAWYKKPAQLNAGNDESSKRFTRYFNQYRVQKLSNRIDPSFKEEVDRIAGMFVYNHLETRDKAIEEKSRVGENERGVKLFWRDALGVEYVPYIERLCEKHGLRVKTTLTRAWLPTITENNRSFYDNWPVDSKHEKDSDDKPDKFKHEGFQAKGLEKSPHATHLPKELEALSQTIEQISDSFPAFDRVILTGDHGASRLAVLAGQETKYDAGAKAEHSGRCCKTSDVEVDEDVPGLLREGEWLVFANYTRFRQSRKANVEVHGGATLEEVVVPVFEITPLDQNATVEVEVLEKRVKKGTSRKPTVLRIFAKSRLDAPVLRLIIDDGACDSKGVRVNDDYHFDFSLPMLKKLGSYTGELYDGSERLCELTFELVSGAGAINDDFDDFDEFAQ